MSAATPSTELHEQPTRFAIACPTCDYLLHGLEGPMVTCPECGDRCDVEELARRYRSQWTTTPRYVRMMRLVVMSLLGALASPIVAFVLMHEAGPLEPLAMMIMMTVVAAAAMVWLAMAASAIRGMPIGRGIALLILLHMAVTGYLLAGVGMTAGFVALITLPLALFNVAVDTIPVLMCIGVILFGIGCALLTGQCWKLDTAVGKACLDHALPEVS